MPVSKILGTHLRDGEETWSENSDVCKSQGGYLISTEPNEEWNFISQKI